MLIAILLMAILLAVLSLNPKFNIVSEIIVPFGCLVACLRRLIVFGTIVLTIYFAWTCYPNEFIYVMCYGLIIYGTYYVLRKPIDKAWDRYQEKKALNRRED